MSGSLTGAVTSEKVTEVYKGNFKKIILTFFLSIMIKNCLTVRLMSHTETKVGHNDPIFS